MSALTTDILTAAQRETIERVVAANAGRPGPLLEILHAVQANLGWIPSAAVPLIAAGLNLSRAEVHGVVTFYHHFRTRAAGRRVLQICRAEACQSMQGEALAAHARARLGVDFGETTPDGAWSLESVYCLGNCACSPAAMIDGHLHGRVSARRLDELLAPTAEPS